jgi:hypothetical protein
MEMTPTVCVTINNLPLSLVNDPHDEVRVDEGQRCSEHETRWPSSDDEDIDFRWICGGCHVEYVCVCVGW